MVPLGVSVPTARRSGLRAHGLFQGVEGGRSRRGSSPASRAATRRGPGACTPPNDALRHGRPSRPRGGGSHLGNPSMCVAEAEHPAWPWSMSYRPGDRLAWAVLASELATEHPDLAIRIAACEVGHAWSTAWAMSLRLVVAVAPTTALHALHTHATWEWPQDWARDWTRVATWILHDEASTPAEPAPTRGRLDAVRAEIARVREVPPTAAERLLGRRDTGAPAGLLAAVRAADRGALPRTSPEPSPTASGPTRPSTRCRSPRRSADPCSSRVSPPSPGPSRPVPDRPGRTGASPGVNAGTRWDLPGSTDDDPEADRPAAGAHRDP